MENATIHGIMNNRCPACIIPTENLGEYSRSGYPPRSHSDYIAAYNKSDGASLKANGVKNIKNALWSIPNINPPDLIRADILHNVLLGVLDHLMDWIQGFLEHHDRINAFDYVWRRLPHYPGFSVPTKAYRVISQWSGKEMRNFGKVILGTFTAALRRNGNQPRPTGGQVQEFNRAIRCVRSITDFYLMTQYASHTDKTISYLQEYLRTFHETKAVFLKFRAGKKTRKAAAEAHKELVKEQTGASVEGLSASEKVRLRQENGLERQELVNDILREGAHFNFPKVHLISHYAEQIPKYGALAQYSTDISEAMHKGFKDAYRRSNKVNSTPQIINTYTRDHTLAMKDLTIDVWTQIREQGDLTLDVGKDATEAPVYLKLKGKIEWGLVSSLENLEQVSGLTGLVQATETFLQREDKGKDDGNRIVQEIRAYRALQIPVPKFSGKGFIMHNARCTKEFRGKDRQDWVWVRRRGASDQVPAGTLNGRIPGRMNALFKLIRKDGTVYRLAHVDILQCIGGTAAQGAEGMFRVGLPRGGAEGIIVRISQIEGMAHLVPLEPGESWLVNNRIDLETWNINYE
jgi:hypothetical protein